MKGLSIIVPTLNEEGNIKALTERISMAMNKYNIEYEILFIDDNSIDKTAQTVTSLHTDYPVSLHTKRGLKGKAHSILEGCSYAKYDIVAFIDADLQYPPEALPHMYGLIMDNQTDIVVTRRIVKYSSFIRQAMSNGFRIVFGYWLHGMNFDIQSGLKMYRKSIMQAFELNPSPWSFDLEFLVKAQKAGYSITSVDIDFTHRTAGETKVGFIKASYEVGLAAVKLKLGMIEFVHLRPKFMRKES
ncbi:MAG: hypothetical protein RI947_851 [Candidatus Parcubacteria bacterium]|jgi:dolichol-phosphate mannosyltransferase